MEKQKLILLVYADSADSDIEDELSESATSLRSKSSATSLRSKSTATSLKSKSSDYEYRQIQISVQGIKEEIVSVSMRATDSSNNTKQTEETSFTKPRQAARKKSMDRSRRVSSSRMATSCSDRSSPDRAPAKSLKTLAKLATNGVTKERNVVERQPVLTPEPPGKYEQDNADFHMLSLSSDVTCPTCGGWGPFVSNVYLNDDRQCVSSCLTAFCKHFCCCSVPKQNWKCVIKCSRCHNQIMVFNTEEEWLLFK